MSKKNSETAESVSSIIRKETRKVLVRRPAKKIMFLELRKKIGEIMKKRRVDFSNEMESPKKLRPDFFIRALLKSNSNLAIYSDGLEVWVTYATHINLLERYVESKTVTTSHSKAEETRRIARDRLEAMLRVSLAEVKEAVEVEKIYFRVQALLIKKASFVISSERSGIFVTRYARVSFYRAPRL